MAIKATLKTKTPCEIVVDATVDRASLDAAYDKTLTQVSRYVDLPGFRIGKAPRALVEKQFRKAVQREAVEDLVVGIVRSVVKQHALEPVTGPHMATELLFPAEGPLTFTVEFEVAPVFELKNYQGLSLVARKAKVTDEDINRMMDSLLEQHSTFEEPAEERPAMFGDWLIVDYVATSEGVQVMKRDEAWVEVSSTARVPVPGFGEQLAGAQKGQTQQIEVTAPADFYTKELAGKHLVFSVTVKKVQERRKPELTNELAKKIDPKCETVKDLRAAVVKNQEQYRGMEEKRRLRDLAREALVRENLIPLPPSMLGTRVRKLVEEQIRHQLEQGQSEQQVKDAVPELQKQLTEVATAQLRAEYVLNSIATAENIEVGEADIQPQLEYYASAFRRDVKWVRRMFEREGHLEGVFATARETKALDLVISKAQVTES